MKRNFELKRRESKNLPPQRLQQILSKIYPEGTVNELMDKFFNGDKHFRLRKTVRNEHILCNIVAKITCEII